MARTQKHKQIFLESLQYIANTRQLNDSYKKALECEILLLNKEFKKLRLSERRTFVMHKTHCKIKFKKLLSNLKGIIKMYHKLDGCYCILKYIDGCLITAHTKQGEDITSFVKDIIKEGINLKNHNNLKDAVYIEGELIINKEDFKKYGSKYLNVLKMVAGYVNSKKKDLEHKHIIKFVSFIYSDDNIRYNKIIKKFEPNDIENIIGNYLGKDSEEFPTDGIVFRGDDIKYITAFKWDVL